MVATTKPARRPPCSSAKNDPGTTFICKSSRIAGKKAAVNNASSPPSDASISCRKADNSTVCCSRAPSSPNPCWCWRHIAKARHPRSVLPHRAGDGLRTALGRIAHPASHRAVAGRQTFRTPPGTHPVPDRAASLVRFRQRSVVRVGLEQGLRDSRDRSGGPASCLSRHGVAGGTVARGPAERRHALCSPLHQRRSRGGPVRSATRFVQPPGPGVLRHHVDLLRGRRRGGIGAIRAQQGSSPGPQADGRRRDPRWRRAAAMLRAVAGQRDRREDVDSGGGSSATTFPHPLDLHRGRPGHDQPGHDRAVAGR